MAAPRPGRQAMIKISAFVSDVDGTVMTHDQELTPRTREAAAKLKARGIPFAIISGRPPRGMRMLVEPLGLTAPMAGFNGGQFTTPDLKPLEDHALAPEAARRTHDLLLAKGIGIWVFDGLDWFVRDPNGPHVAHEIVGVSDDYDGLARIEGEMQAALGNTAAATRSQKYYLDVTHPQANKGEGVQRLAALMGVPMDEVAVIGDGGNDVAMFQQSGLSIAMGNASEEVKKHARFVTGSNEEDGFADAVEKYVLGTAR